MALAVSYTDHARRYLATLEGREETTGTPCEKSEISEKRVGTREGEEPPIVVWWKDSSAAVAPIVWSPPRGCLGPVACSRLGPCDRHVAGQPCTTATTGGAERREGVG